MALDEELGRAIGAMIVATVVSLMHQDLDVTDDAIGRELHRDLHARVGKGKTSQELAATCTETLVTEWAGAMAAKIRRTSSMAVAVTLDEDPGADESTTARYVHGFLLDQVGKQHSAVLLPEFALRIARVYSAMCRRSGLPPERWANAFSDSVSQGHWAFRRD